MMTQNRLITRTIVLVSFLLLSHLSLISASNTTKPEWEFEEPIFTGAKMAGDWDAIQLNDSIIIVNNDWDSGFKWRKRNLDSQ